MKLHADARVDFPRPLVFSTYRDRLPELVPHLPNIRRIEVLSRDDAPGGQTGITKLLNLWVANADVPSVAQKIIKPEMLTWKDYATWNENDWSVDWRIETQLFTENVRCFGRNVYVEEGNGVVLQIRGELEVSLKGLPGVPSLLAGAIAPAVEKFIIALLTPNLTSVAKGLDAFLRASPSP